MKWQLLFHQNQNIRNRTAKDAPAQVYFRTENNAGAGDRK